MVKYFINWSNAAVEPDLLQLTIHAPNYNLLSSGSRLKNKRSKNDVAAPEAEAKCTGDPSIKPPASLKA
jgi:hypothetical protein